MLPVEDSKQFPYFEEPKRQEALDYLNNKHLVLGDTKVVKTQLMVQSQELLQRSPRRLGRRLFSGSG